MPHVDPGELKYRITIKNRTRTRDANDHYVETVQEIPARAGVRAVRSSDEREYGADRQVETLQFILRWRRDVTTDSVISWRGHDYEIEYIDPTPWAGVYMRIRGVSYDAGVGA